MNIEAHRWLMKAVDTPLERAAFDAEPGPGEVAVADRRLRRLPHRPGLLLRRRAHQARAAAGARPRGQRPGAWPAAPAPRPGRARRSSCRRCCPAANAICAGAACPPSAAQQKMPGNDIQGGFASHIVVPGRGLCEVDEARLARAGLTLAQVSIVADALTTPYQAVRRAGRHAGQPGHRRRRRRRRRLLRAGGARLRRQRGRDRRRRCQAGGGRAHGAALTLNSRTLDAKAIKAAVLDFAKQNGPAQHRVVHLRMFGQRARAAHRLQPAGARRHAVGGRLHDGQGRSCACPT